MGTRAPLARRAALFLPLLLLFVAVPLVAGHSGAEHDETAYLRYAHQLTHGHYARVDGIDADYLWYGPGLPLVLTPLVALDAPLDVLRLVGPVALFVAVLAFDGLLRMRVGDRAALIGTYALGLYPAFSVVLLRRIFSEPLALMFITLGLLCLAHALDSRGRLYVALAGLAFGFLALTKVGFGWIVIVVALGLGVAWLVRRRRAGPAAAATLGRSAAAFAVAGVVCVPWLTYTFVKTDRPLYWGNSGGINLYWMASPYPGDLGDWHGYTVTRPQHRPFFRSIAHLGPVEKDVRVQKKALKLIRGHPAKYVRNVGANVSRLFLEVPYSYDKPSLRQSAVFALPNLLLLALLALSLPTLLRSRRRLPPEALPFATFAVVALVFHSLLSAEARMLVPMLPVGIWFVVYALAELRAVPALRPLLAPGH